MFPIQLNLQVAKRFSPWLALCPDCQNERVVTYAQAWNIKKGNSVLCPGCVPRLSPPPRSGNGPKSRVKGLGSKSISYVNFWGGGFVTAEGKRKQRKAKLGKYGPEANRWRGGYVNERAQAAQRDEYKQLRFLVFKRDSFLCTECKTKNGPLEMDHIKEWRNYPELRYDPSNCRTLCKPCHTKTDNYGQKAIKKGTPCL